MKIGIFTKDEYGYMGIDRNIEFFENHHIKTYTEIKQILSYRASFSNDELVFEYNKESLKLVLQAYNVLKREGFLGDILAYSNVNEMDNDELTGKFIGYDVCGELGISVLKHFNSNYNNDIFYKIIKEYFKDWINSNGLFKEYNKASEFAELYKFFYENKITYFEYDANPMPIRIYCLS